MCWFAPAVRTCPTVQSSNEENCVDECSSDDDCQYDRICCSNGCGGHTCSDSVEMCEVSISVLYLILHRCYLRCCTMLLSICHSIGILNIALPVLIRAKRNIKI